MRHLILLLPLLGGCAKSVIPLYEAARDEALRDPGPPPANWVADAWVQISSPSLDDLLLALLEENALLTETFDAGIVQVTPRLNLSDLAIMPSNGCADCLTVDLGLTGTVAWKGALGTGSTALSGTGQFDAVFDVVQDAGDWTVSTKPRKLRNIGVSLAGNKLGIPIGPITDWITSSLLENVPALVLTTFPAEDLPLRAVRVVPVQKAVRVEVLTRAPDPVAAPAPPPRVPQGWAVGISTGSLLAAARAEAFRKGPITYDVVAEPTALDITPDSFTLGLRLWRIAGKGWWRDYTVLGKVALGPDGVELTAERVVEGPKSDGAVVADPLAALGEGRILDGLEKAIAITLPADETAKVGGVRTSVRLQELIREGDGGLRANGSLDVLDAPPGEPGKRPRPKVRP